MVKFENYNPNINCNCVVRSLSKILGEDVKIVEKELINLSRNMDHTDYTDIEVFEKYMEMNNIFKDARSFDDIQIKDIDFSNGKYIVFCWNKDEFYHLVSIIDNVLYDKKEETLNLYPITIYKK